MAAVVSFVDMRERRSPPLNQNSLKHDSIALDVLHVVLVAS